MHIEKMNDGFRKYIENDSIHFIDCNCLTGVCTIYFWEMPAKEKN